MQCDLTLNSLFKHFHCVCVVCMHMSMCMWRPEDDIQCLPLCLPKIRSPPDPEQKLAGYLTSKLSGGGEVGAGWGGDGGKENWHLSLCHLH